MHETCRTASFHSRPAFPEMPYAAGHFVHTYSISDCLFFKLGSFSLAIGVDCSPVCIRLQVARILPEIRRHSNAFRIYFIWQRLQSSAALRLPRVACVNVLNVKVSFASGFHTNLRTFLCALQASRYPRRGRSRGISTDREASAAWNQSRRVYIATFSALRGSLRA